MKRLKIKSEKEYTKALRHIDELWGSKKNTPKGKVLEKLITRVLEYENKYHKI